MNSASNPPGEWSRARWWLALAAVLAAQVGLIFALGERTPPRPRVVGPVQSLQLTVARNEIQELLDPTLFTRPHARDFSAASWLRVAAPVFPVFRWTEPPRPLELPVNELGAALRRFLRTNEFAAFSLAARPAPEMFTRVREDVTEAATAQSRLGITGGLAGRTLLNPPALPAWPADDLLTNTLVQVQVDVGGRVLSAVLLGAERVSGGSGSLAADQLALTLARNFRFAPRANGNWLANPVAQLTPGVLVFEWRTVPATNGATAGKSP